MLVERGRGIRVSSLGDPEVLDRYHTFLHEFKSVPLKANGFLNAEEDLLYSCPILGVGKGEDRFFLTTKRILTFRSLEGRKNRNRYFVISLPYFSVTVIRRFEERFELKRADGPLPDREPYFSYQHYLKGARDYAERFPYLLDDASYLCEPKSNDDKIHLYALAKLSGDAGTYNVGPHASRLEKEFIALQKRGVFLEETEIILG